MIRRLTISFVLFFVCCDLGASERLVCNTDIKVPYKAELSGTDDSRSVEVTFNKRPSSAVANKIVAACMKVAIERDSKHELLGSAWVGETHFVLAPGKENLAYTPKDGSIRPFGLDDAIKGLKRK